MKDYISIGSAPCDEECAQVGEEGCEARAVTECERFIMLLVKTFGPPPKGARLSVQVNRHDFGAYYDVVCHYDDNMPESRDYAFNMENNAPNTWE